LEALSKIITLQHIYVKVNSPASNSQTTLLEDISLCINQGEILGITGESGSGKSMLGRTIMGLVSIKKGFVVEGKVVFENQNLLTLSENELSKIRGAQISIVFENPSSAFNPLKKIGKQILESITVHNKTSKSEAKKQIFEAMDALDLIEHERVFNAYPHELSGGQLQRLLLISSSINRPKILILDEATSQLDQTTIEKVIVYINHIRNKFATSILFISHDLKLLTSLSDRIIMIKDGIVIDSFVNNGKHFTTTSPYTQSYLNQNLSQGQNKYIITSEPVLVLKNINKSFSKYLIYPFLKLSTNDVLKDINFALNQGEILGIMGPSGSGKSTLAKIIVKMTAPDSGIIRLLGNDISDLTTTQKQLSSIIQMLFQDAHASLNPLQKVSQIFSDVIKVHWTKDVNKEEIMLEALANVSLSPDILDRYPNEMSGGQKHRVCIARALLCKPKILILDESLSALDIVNQIKMIELFQKLRTQLNLSIIFIAHDLRLSQALCDRIITIDNGKMVEYEPK